MRNIHKIIFVICLLTSVICAYFLTKVNLNSKLDFAWFSTNDQFLSISRDLYGKWNVEKYPKNLKFDIISDKKIISINGENEIKNITVPDVDFENEFLIFASLGQVDSNGYTINIKEISQHGNVIEIMTFLSSPYSDKMLPYNKQYPIDIVKINKDQLFIDGNLLFIFKDYNGNELYRKECEISATKNISVDKI